jgi:hypothetical protein
MTMRWMAALISCAVLSQPVLAREIDPAERREVPFDANLPVCSDPLVLYTITDEFATREGRFWNSGLTIVGFERVAETAWRPWGLDYIPRRFCTGIVSVSNGTRHRIEYSIREDLGFIGATWGAEWCVDGLDRHYAFAPACKQARP